MQLNIFVTFENNSEDFRMGTLLFSLYTSKYKVNSARGRGATV